MLWAAAVFVALMLYQMSNPNMGGQSTQELSYSEILDLVENNQVSQISIQGNKLQAVGQDGGKITATAPYDPDLIKIVASRFYFF